MRKDLQDFDSQGITPDRHITKLVRADPVLLPCGSKDCGDFPWATAVSRIIGSISIRALDCMWRRFHKFRINFTISNAVAHFGRLAETSLFVRSNGPDLK